MSLRRDRGSRGSPLPSAEKRGAPETDEVRGWTLKVFRGPAEGGPPGCPRGGRPGGTEGARDRRGAGLDLARNMSESSLRKARPGDPEGAARGVRRGPETDGVRGLDLA